MHFFVTHTISHRTTCHITTSPKHILEVRTLKITLCTNCMILYVCLLCLHWIISCIIVCFVLFMFFCICMFQMSSLMLCTGGNEGTCTDRCVHFQQDKGKPEGQCQCGHWFRHHPL